MRWTKAAVICFYLLLIVGLALYDEKLSPQLVRDMAQPLPEVIEPGNGWIAFLGFDAPPGVSPYVHGEAEMRKYRDARLAGKLSELSRAADADKSGLHFKGKVPTFYGMKGGMAAFAAAHPDEVAALGRDNEELLRRYEGLRTYPRYSEPVDDGFLAPIPGYAPIKKSCQVKLLQLAGKAGQGVLSGPLERVREDAVFWRSIARSSNTLISKMVAFAILKLHFRVAADLGGSRQLNGKELAIVEEILRPFDRSEIGLAGTLRGEFRCLQQTLRLLPLEAEPRGFVTTLLYKPNATRNRHYDDWQALDYIRIAEMTPQQFALEWKKAQVGRQLARRLGIPFLYNPAGEIMWVRDQIDYFPYIAVGHDLEGFRRLARLKVLARAENISVDGMQQFLDSHKTELGNPYSGGAMTWNPEKSSISFPAGDGQYTMEILL